MNKSKLNRFVEKYHLSGNVNSVALKTSGDSLSTRFMSGDKSLLGELSMVNWDFKDSEIGVYDTEQFVKLLVKAFQRRFRADLINGIPDKECLFIAKNLLKS